MIWFWTLLISLCLLHFFFVFQILTLMWLPVAVWGKNTMCPLHWNLQYEKSGSKNKLSHRSTRSESHSYCQSNLCKLFVDYLLKMIWQLLNSPSLKHRLIQLTFQNCKNPLITAMQHFGLGFIFAEKDTFQYDFS